MHKELPRSLSKPKSAGGSGGTTESRAFADHATFNDGGICQHKNILFCNCLESFHKNTNALKNLSRNDSKSIYIPILFYIYPSSIQ